MGAVIGRSSSSVSPESGDSGTHSRTQVENDSSTPGIFNSIRFVPPIRHVSPDNPWLQLLSPEQLVEISGAFKQFDMNGDGHIDVNEIVTVMRNLGYPRTLEEAKKIAESVDADGNGMIEFDEFVGMIASRMLRTDGVAELHMAFSTLFDDDSGFVDVALLRKLFKTCGSYRLSDEEVDIVLELCDVNADGRIPYQQLRDLPCWDLTLPDGALVTLRDGNPASPSSRAPAPKPAPAPPSAPQPPSPRSSAALAAPSANAPAPTRLPPLPGAPAPGSSPRVLPPAGSAPGLAPAPSREGGVPPAPAPPQAVR